MNETEQLSALMDDEALYSADDWQRAARDPAWRQRWVRYHQAQDILHNRASAAHLEVDLVAKVRVEIMRETATSPIPESISELNANVRSIWPRFIQDKRKTAWWSGAVAAGVLTITVFWGEDPQQNPPVLLGPVASAPHTAPVGRVAVQLSPQAVQRLQGYVSGAYPTVTASPVALETQ